MVGFHGESRGWSEARVSLKYKDATRGSGQNAELETSKTSAGDDSTKSDKVQYPGLWCIGTLLIELNVEPAPASVCSLLFSLVTVMSYYRVGEESPGSVMPVGATDTDGICRV